MDPKQNLFVINDAPDNTMSTELAVWLHRLGVWDRATPKNFRERYNDCQHNAVIEWALTTQHDWFVFVESDIRPDIQHTRAFWECEADVVGCRYPTEKASAWDHPYVIHAGLWRTRREVLEAITPPWFEWRFNAKRTKTIACLCQTFCTKVLAAGYTIEQAGYAMHRPRKHI